MKRKSEDQKFDKARERMLQFEAAREPQLTNEDLLDDLDELIQGLEAKNEPLTLLAAERLKQFRTKIYSLTGSLKKYDQETSDE